MDDSSNQNSLTLNWRKAAPVMIGTYQDQTAEKLDTTIYCMQSPKRVCFTFQITWADLMVFSFFETMRMQHGDEKAFGPCTALKNHNDFIQDLPRIKAWIEKRPVTPRQIVIT